MTGFRFPASPSGEGAFIQHVEMKHLLGDRHRALCRGCKHEKEKVKSLSSESSNCTRRGTHRGTNDNTDETFQLRGSAVKRPLAWSPGERRQCSGADGRARWAEGTARAEAREREGGGHGEVRRRMRAWLCGPGESIVVGAADGSSPTSPEGREVTFAFRNTYLEAGP